MDLFLLERKKEAEPNCKRDVGSKLYLTCLTMRAVDSGPESGCSGGHANIKRRGQFGVSGGIDQKDWASAKAGRGGGFVSIMEILPVEKNNKNPQTPKERRS